MSRNIYIFLDLKMTKFLNTCCKNSLSGCTVCFQVEVLPSASWKTTFVSFRKFLPRINSSTPPVAGHDVRDFLHISGTPGGWAVFIKTENSVLKTTYKQFATTHC